MLTVEQLTTKLGEIDPIGILGFGASYDEYKPEAKWLIIYIKDCEKHHANVRAYVYECVRFCFIRYFDVELTKEAINQIVDEIMPI